VGVILSSTPGELKVRNIDFRYFFVYTIHMSTYIKPSADIFIRYLFGKQANEELLLSFVNAVLEDSCIPTGLAF
jgi:hypothetical protein